MEISPPIAEIHTAAMDGSDLDHQIIGDGKFIVNVFIF